MISFQPLLGFASPSGTLTAKLAIALELGQNDRNA
jgi:hypothetical protein